MCSGASRNGAGSVLVRSQNMVRAPFTRIAAICAVLLLWMRMAMVIMICTTPAAMKNIHSGGIDWCACDARVACNRPAIPVASAAQAFVFRIFIEI